MVRVKGLGLSLGVGPRFGLTQPRHGLDLEVGLGLWLIEMTKVTG